MSSSLGKTGEGPAALIANVRSLLAHDLKNPLSAAWTVTELMRELDDGTDPLVSRNIEIVQSAASRAISWIEDVALTIELETGQRTVERKATTVQKVVASALEGPFRAEDLARLTLPPPEPMAVEADPYLLSRGLHALITNGLLHGGKRGTVEVEAHRDGDGLVFQVLDQGDGVPEERRERLFLPLSSERRAQDRIGGIGLAVTRACVEVHGGSVGYERRDSGGSLFWLRIPDPERE